MKCFGREVDFPLEKAKEEGERLASLGYSPKIYGGKFEYCVIVEREKIGNVYDPISIWTGSKWIDFPRNFNRETICDLVQHLRKHDHMPVMVERHGGRLDVWLHEDHVPRDLSIVDTGCQEKKG